MQNQSVTDLITFDLIKNLFQKDDINSIKNVIETLLKSTVSSKESYLHGIIRYACKYERAQLITHLHGRFDLNVSCVGLRPIHHACYYDNLEAVIILVEYGSDVNCRDINEETPAHYAAKLDNDKILSYLHSKGANLQAIDALTKCPIHYACENNTTDTLKYLINQGVNLECVDYNGSRPVHYAAYNENETLLECLIDRVDLEAENYERERASHIAAKNTNIKVIKLLTNNKVQIDHHNEMGYTPLRMALLTYNQEVYHHIKKLKIN